MRVGFGENTKEKLHLDARIIGARNDKVVTRDQVIMSRDFRSVSERDRPQVLQYPLSVVTGGYLPVRKVLPKLECEQRTHVSINQRSK